MKKTVLLMFGLFALMACSDEVVPEATDVTQDEGMAPPTVSPELTSPYDFSMYGNPITYIVINNSNIGVDIAPYIGLAYFDGADDGIYNTPSGAINLSAGGPGGGYPNLYAGGNEYLNLFEGQHRVIAPFTTTNFSTGAHTPTYHGQLLNVQAHGATLDETVLLSNAGKCYYIEIKIYAPGGGILLTDKIKPQFTYTLGPTTPNFSFGNWNYLGYIAPPAYVETFYYNSLSSEISAGIVSNPSAAKDELNFTHGGNNYSIRLYSTATEVILEIN